MVTLHTRPVGIFGVGEGLGSGSGVWQLHDQMRVFISSEITHNIIDQTLLIFSTVKEGILEILDERLGAFRTEMEAMMAARMLTFREFRACGAPKYHGARDPIASSKWLVDIANAFHTSRCPKGDKVRLASCLLKDIVRDW